MLFTLILWTIVGAAVLLLERHHRNNGQRLKKILLQLERLKQEDKDP